MTLAKRTDMSLRELLWVSAGFVVLTLLFMAPLLTELTTSLPGDVRDPLLNAWTLAWGSARLPYGLQGFWSPPIFYPYQNTVAYTENLLGIALLVAPVYWVSRDAVLTYNIAFLLSFVVAGIGTYLLARELTGRRDAALVAACAFTFAPYKWAQHSHLQVLSVGWLPLALWALHVGFRSPSLQILAVFVASVLLLAFSNGYAAYQGAFAIAVAGCWCAVTYGMTRAQLLRIAAAVGIIGLLLSPAIVAHLRVWANRPPVGADLTRYAADLGTYFDVTTALPDARWLPGVSQDEGHLFPGVIVVLMAAVAFARQPKKWPANRWRWLYLGIATLAVVISLGPEPKAWGRSLPIPPVYSWMLAFMPLFHALRVPARFGMLVLLAFALLASMGTARVLAGLAGWRAAAVTGALCAVILWEGYGGPLVLKPTAHPEARGDAAAYAWLSAQPPGALLELPTSVLSDPRFELQYQFAAIDHGHPFSGGVSRVKTPLQTLLGGSASPLINPDLLAEAVPFLQGLGIRYVLSRPKFFSDPGIATRLIAALESSDRLRRVAQFTDVTAYEIAAAPEPPADPVPITRVPATAMRLSASPHDERAALAMDGDPSTRWLSGAPQNGTEWIAVEFDRPRDLARLDFTMSARSLQDYPREIEIVGTAFAARLEERVLYRGRVLHSLGRGFRQSPELPVASIDLPPLVSTRVVVRQIGRAQPWYWSVDELAVWERASSGRMRPP